MRRNVVGVVLVFLAGAAFGATAVGCAVHRAKAETPPPAVDAEVSGRATGIGGIFFKAKEPKKLQAWYVEHLGFPAPKYGVQFEWRDMTAPEKPGSTTWGAFSMTTTYFDPTNAPFMINYRVTNLDALLAHLRAAGVKVDDKIESEENGRFAWAIDPEGNRFELWEPTPGH